MHYILILYFLWGTGTVTATRTYDFNNSERCKTTGDAYVANDPKHHGYECIVIRE